jgi:mono/diheme cytochrome c family protein
MRWIVMMLSGIILFSGGYLLAQSVDLDEALTCDPTDLVFDQLNAHESLRDFGPDLAQDPTAALSQLYETGLLYQELALACGHIPEDAGELFAGTDVERILTVLETIQADPLNGQLIYNNLELAADGTELGCIGCHMDEDSTGPPTEGTWTRWDEIRSELPQFEDYTFEQYMVESIVHPWDYTAPGYAENIMPNNYGDRMSYQDLADVIAYLSSQDQLLPDD